MINLFLAKLAYKADNWAGDGKKLLGYTFLAFCFLFPVVGLMDALGVFGLLLIPYSILCALAYRKWGAWGELFPHDKHNFDPKHRWFYRLLDKLYGEAYVRLNKEQSKQWKVIGWGVRYAIYGLPIALLYAVNHIYNGDFLNVITPFLILPLAGIVRGAVYWYGLENKNLEWCERWGGAMAMFLIITSGM